MRIRPRRPFTNRNTRRRPRNANGEARDARRRLFRLEVLEDRRVLAAFWGDAPLVSPGAYPVTSSEGGASQEFDPASGGSGNTGLIPNSNGNLTFTPAVNQSGSATITVSVEDGGLDGILETAADNVVIAGQFAVLESTANFFESGQTLNLNPQGANQTIEARAISSGYQFTLSTGTWSGINSARVSGNGTSVLTVSAVGRDFYDTIEIDDSAANISVRFVDSGPNFFSESITVNLDRMDAGEIRFTGATRLTGPSSIHALTTKAIVVSESDTVVSTTDGDLILKANTQPVRRADVDKGVTITDATVEVTGSGDLEIEGRAGGTLAHSDGNLRGVQIWRSVVSGGTTGANTFITGIGGTSTGDFNMGVHLAQISSSGQRSTITSSGADVTINAIAGGSGASLFNPGLFMANGVLITAGQNGDVTVSGQGALSAGDQNYGVYVGNAASGLRSTITSSGGNVRVTGQGGGVEAARFNDGVRLWDTGLITAGGAGTVTVIGQGGDTTAGANNIGVSVFESSSIESSGGDVIVTGTGGGLDSSGSDSNHGVEVRSGGLISSGGAGNVQVNGTGGMTNGPANLGVKVGGVASDGSRSTITSSGSGAISVNGTGGGSNSTNSTWNHGAHVTEGGQIIASGANTLSINANGGEGGGGYNYGLLVDKVHAVTNDQSRVTTENGALNVSGTRFCKYRL